MKQIRNKVFETNSSSIHSVAVYRNGGEKDAIEYLEKHGKEIEVKCGEFGWEVETYTHPLDKLSYAYTLACSSDWTFYEEKKDFIETVLCRIGFEPKFEEVKKKTFGENNEYEQVRTMDGFGCYVDHAFSWDDDFVDRLFSDESFFLQFVFSQKSYILTGNDNVYNDNLGRHQPADYPETEFFYKGN